MKIIVEVDELNYDAETVLKHFPRPIVLDLEADTDSGWAELRVRNVKVVE